MKMWCLYFIFFKTTTNKAILIVCFQFIFCFFCCFLVFFCSGLFGFCFLVLVFFLRRNLDSRKFVQLVDWKWVNEQDSIGCSSFFGQIPSFRARKGNFNVFFTISGKFQFKVFYQDLDSFLQFVQDCFRVYLFKDLFYVLEELVFFY